MLRGAPVLLAVAILATCRPSGPEPPGPGRRVPPRAVAEALGRDPSRLAVLAGTRLGTMKVHDLDAGRLWLVTLGGRTTATPPRRAAGPCEPAFLEAIGDPAPHWVLIRYRAGEEEDLDREALDDLPRQEVADRLLRREDLIAREIAAMHPGLAPDCTGAGESFGPFVVDECPGRSVRDLCARPEVLFVGPYREPEVQDQSPPSIPQSLPTTRTDEVQQLGILGQGVRIAVLERGGLFVGASCFALAGVQDPAAGPSSHITLVMAMLGNTFPFDQDAQCGDSPAEGYAPAAELLMANAETMSDQGPTSDWLEAGKWAIRQAADLVTMSFHNPSEETSGQLGSRDVFFDYLASRLWVTVFTSAGNQGGANAFASGKGYNLVGVADVLNHGDDDRCAAAISATSSWRNPETSHHDRELPELAMPGSRYSFRGTDFDIGRTSAATPAAAGIAALLVRQAPVLRFWPEAIRALLLAGADYQMADGMMWAPSPYRDGHDGVGLVNAWQAHRAAAVHDPSAPSPYGHDYGELTAASFDPLPAVEQATGEAATGEPRLAPPRFLARTWRIEVPAPEARVRAALTWNSNVESDEGASVLDLDLDLVVLDPDGNPVAWSVTFDNNYELVDFHAAKAGTYRLAAFAFTVPPDLENAYGVAWMVSGESCPA